MTGQLYKTLGVKRDAGEADIQKAYRGLAKKYHPDLKPGDKSAEERFKKITRAYDTLRDKDKRARYDQGLIDDEGNDVHPGFGGFGGGFNGARRGGAGFGAAGGTEYATGGFRFRGGRGFDDIINDLFGAGARGAGAAGPEAFGFEGMEMNPGETRHDLDVGFVEAALGGTRRIVLPNGRTIDLKIPAGAEDGQVMRLRGQGVAGPAGAGDLLVVLKVGGHAQFRREGLDVLVDCAVPLATAVKGGRVRVPTLTGDVNLKVPAWTTSGQTLRLKGRGIKAGGREGDQRVRLLVDLPAAPDPELKDALERWAATQPV